MCACCGWGMVAPELAQETELERICGCINLSIHTSISTSIYIHLYIH